MTAVIVTDDGMSASTLLVGYSALKWCTASSGIAVTRNWPRLSSGEELLWSVLAAVNGQGNPPLDADLAAGLDDLNLHYARCALDLAGVTA